MEIGKEVCRHIKITDNLKTSTLSVADQIRLLFSKVSNSDVAELDAMEKVSAERLKQIARLSRFIDKVTSRLSDSDVDSATVALSSEFIPYFDEVFDPVHGKGRFYKFTVHERDIHLDIQYKVVVHIQKKYS